MKPTFLKSELVQRQCKQMEAETRAASFGIRVQSLQPTDSGRPSHVVPDLIYLFFLFLCLWDSQDTFS